MNTLSNAYIRKFSSGTLLALLAISGFFVLVPAVTPIHASSAANPTIALYPGQQWAAGGSSCPSGCQHFTLNVTNPASNTVSIKSITFQASNSGFSEYYCSYDKVNSFFDKCTGSGNTVTWYADSSGVSLPPGLTTYIGAAFDVPTAATYPSTVTWSVSWTDSLGNVHAAPSITTHIFNPTASAPSIITSVPEAVPGTPGNVDFVAGSSSMTVTSNIGVANAGVIVTFYAEKGTGAVGSFSGTGVTCVASFLCYAATNSAGTVSATYTPSNTEGTSYVYVVYGGNTAWNFDYKGLYPLYEYWADNSTTVTTVAAAPTQVTITLPGSALSTAPNNYLTTSATEPGSSPAVTGATMASGTYTVSLTDRFGNAVAFATGDVLTLSASNGVFATPSATPTTTKSSITCADFSGAVCPTSGTSYTVANAYFQSATYGTIGSISATLVVGTKTYSGLSGNLITSTFAASTVAPVTEPASAGTVCGSTPSAECVNAGSTITVKDTLSTAQLGVPVTLYLDAASTQVNNDGHFTSGGQSVSLTSLANGTVGASYVTDTGAGAKLGFIANIAAPKNGAPTNMLGNSTSYVASSWIETIAGPAAKLTLSTCFDSACATATKYAVDVAGTYVYVNVGLADKYNNPTTNSLGYQLQINLSGPGSFSATSVYIKQGQSNTYTSFGVIKWDTPTTNGPATVTATSSLGSASKTITIVSALPSLYVNTANNHPLPSGKTFYVSSTSVVFAGNASVSLGYPTSTNIASIGYTIGSGSSGSSGYATIVPSNVVNPWSVILSLKSGLNTVSFNATDGAGNTYSTGTITVLVDTVAPSVSFTTANNANISSPATVSASIVDSQGDLNTSSVSAVATNIQTSATKTLTASVTGTNSPGHSVKYGVSISGLTTGNWTVKLSASDLAGNSNSSTITVHVTVPFAQSFVVSGTPHTATIGSFSGINASYTNLNPTSQSVVVFAVFKNGAGQTMGIGTGSLTVGAGATQSVFIAEPIGLASGTYSVSIFVFTTGNLPVSVSTSISVTV